MFYLCEVNFFGIKVKILKLLNKIEICCLKCIILVDGMFFEGEDWSEIRDKIESKRFDEVSFLEKVFEEIGEEMQLKEVLVSDSIDMGDVIKECFCYVFIEKDIYKIILLCFDFLIQQEVMKIYEFKDYL